MSAITRQFTVARAFSQLLHLIFPVLLLAVSASSARAQKQALRDGMRVSIATSTSKHIIGIVKSVEPDSVRLYTGDNGAVLAIAVNDITSVRVSQGRSAMEGAKRGALWGTGVGALLAVVVAVATKEDEYYGTGLTRGDVAMQALLGGVTWGVGIGAFAKRERWETVSIQPHVSSTSSGVRLGFSFNSGLLH